MVDSKLIVVDSKLILLSYCHIDILSTVGRQCRQLIDSVDSVDSQGSGSRVVPACAVASAECNMAVFVTK